MNRNATSDNCSTAVVTSQVHSGLPTRLHAHEAGHQATLLTLGMDFFFRYPMTPPAAHKIPSVAFACDDPVDAIEY